MADYELDKAFFADAAIGSSATGPDLATSYDYFIAVKGGTAAASTADSLPHAIPVSAATDVVLGVAQNRVLAADLTAGAKPTVDVRMAGVSKWLVSSANAVVRHTRVAVDASGRCTPAATAAGSRVDGIALEAGAVNTVIDVFLTPQGQV